MNFVATRKYAIIFLSMSKLFIPLSVPGKALWEYRKNWKLATHKTGRLMLFAGDQKIEHLNDDFYGPGISQQDASPEHLFQIASQARIGAFACQLGLIAQYGKQYRRPAYIVKLNSKTNILPTTLQDPVSADLNTVEDVVEFKKNSRLNIVGVGYTIYPGSRFEDQMLAQASRTVWQAHQAGLLAVLWMYPRGQAVKNDRDPHLAAGLAGVAACLGADFVKLSEPKNLTKEKYRAIIQAAGRTGVIFSGGSSTDPKKFLTNLDQQIKNGLMGNATGRNIHQKSLQEAVNFCNAISAISLYNYNAAEAYKIYLGKKTL